MRKGTSGERCERCGQRSLLVWHAPDTLWAAVIGKADESMPICPACFDAAAWDNDILLSWSCRDPLTAEEAP